MLCLGMHSNVMPCFMVQALQDPPLCSRTHLISLMCAIRDSLYSEDLDKTMEVLEAKLPKFFSGLGSLHRELGNNQQDIRNRNRVTHSYELVFITYELYLYVSIQLKSYIRNLISERRH
jgi:hypothetical protein